MGVPKQDLAFQCECVIIDQVVFRNVLGKMFPISKGNVESNKFAFSVLSPLNINTNKEGGGHEAAGPPTRSDSVSQALLV